MIPAPFVGGCPSMVDGVAWLALTASGVDRLPWLTVAGARIMFLAPTLLLTLAAVWVWHARRVNAAAGVALAAVAVHPPLLLGLAPLLAAARSRVRFSWADGLRLAALLAGSIAVLAGATPHCNTPLPSEITALAAQSVRTLRVGAGAIALVLALFESVRVPHARHTRTAWLVVGCALLAVVLFQSFDARLTLVPAAFAIWWLAAHAARALIGGQVTAAARAGTIALLALVPLLQAVVVSAGMDTGHAAPLSARSAIEALNQTQIPTAIVHENVTHDVLLRWWQAGNGRAAHTQVLDHTDSRLADQLRTRTLYAFNAGARQLQDRGILVGSLATQSSAPILWRAFASIGCRDLSDVWQDITPLAVVGQLSGVFAQGATGRHAVIYAALPREALVGRIDWSAEAHDGLRVVRFNLTDQQQRTAFHRSALADDFPITYVPAETPFLVRLILGRMEHTPGALAIAFDSIPTRIFARLDTGTSTDRLHLCGSTRELVATGYSGAPDVTPLDIRSPATIGAGWHVLEREGEVRFRWMATADAELRFVAVAPVSLALEVDALERQGGGSPQPDAVTLNGAPASCAQNQPSCVWMLPADAMQEGLNTITLRASSPLKISGARIRASSVLRMR